MKVEVENNAKMKETLRGEEHRRMTRGAGYRFRFGDRVRRRRGADSVASCKDAGVPWGTSRRVMRRQRNYIDEGESVS
jgi:hypothetical protein